MSSMDSIAAVVEKSVAHFGQIDILVNNAGMNIREPIEEVTEEHYDQIMDVNLKGLYFLTQRVAKHMMARASGARLSISAR